MDEENTFSMEEELRRCQEQLQELRQQHEEALLENARLRLQQEITETKLKLEHTPATISTPITRTKMRPALFAQEACASPDRRKPEVDETNACEQRPDRFITKRKKASGDQTQGGGVVMKPATYDGTGSWSDYKAHFQACAELNNWTYAKKGLYLSVSLRGQAQGVFGNLSSKTTDYNELVKALEERFAPPNQTELYRVQLRDRRQRAHETMAELRQDIRRLTNLAYPSAPGDVRETLAKEQFVDALLHADMRLKIKQSRPVDLNDAVRHAVELEAFYRAEPRHGASSITKTDSGDKSELESLKKMLEQLKCTVNEMKSKQKDQQSKSHFGRNSKQLSDTARA